MEIGTVIGSIWATKKSEKILGQKLLVIELLKSKGKEPADLLVAADHIGAGTGDRVLVCRGSAARILAGDVSVPVDASVAGIVDSLDISDQKKREVFGIEY